MAEEVLSHWESAWRLQRRSRYRNSTDSTYAADLWDLNRERGFRVASERIDERMGNAALPCSVRLSPQTGSQHGSGR